MKILLLSQWFDPEPTFKGLLFARKLQELGHEVEVITGYPNYPSGKLYPGYRQKWRTREIIDGVSVVRVPLYANHDNSATKRVLNYFSFAFTSCIYGILFAKRADIIYVYHPPMTVGVSGALISLFRRTPFVYDVQDLWPDTLRATGMLSNVYALKMVAIACNWIYSCASHIVVLSPGFQRLLIDRGVPDAKLSVIYNWCDENALKAPGQAAVDLSFMDGRFNVVFAGNMGKAQALSAVIKAAKILSVKDARIQFVFVGAGLEMASLKKLSATMELTNVRFISQMPMAEVGTILARADTLLVHLRNDPLFTITIPSKTQAYMAVGKPILMAVDGDAADLIKQARAGVVVMPENPESIAKNVLHIACLSEKERLKMGKNASEFYQRELSLDVGCKKFLDIFEIIVANKSAQVKG